MSALFNFQSLLLVVLLLICTCTYVRAVAPGLIDRNKQGFVGLFLEISTYRGAFVAIRITSLYSYGSHNYITVVCCLSPLHLV
ncbi:hypothetical protein OPQ81_006005 [Rhizoctonia solani]|nr:hypothetical protein OPQ81_006005 [Rhizoctonia solani]